MELAVCRRKVDALVARRRLAVEQVRAEEVLLEKASIRVESTVGAQQVAQAIAQTLQQRAHRQIASVVSRCLAAVFDDPYEFRIDFERKRGKTEARLVFVRDGLELGGVLDGVGGGVVDVAALGLRLACVLLARPPVRKLVVLDEPFRFVSRDHRPRVRAMVEMLAGELGMQFVVVTHDEAFQLGKVVVIE